MFSIAKPIFLNRQGMEVQIADAPTYPCSTTQSNWGIEGNGRVRFSATGYPSIPGALSLQWGRGAIMRKQPLYDLAGLESKRRMATLVGRE